MITVIKSLTNICFPGLFVAHSVKCEIRLWPSYYVYIDIVKKHESNFMKNTSFPLGCPNMEHAFDDRH